MESDYLSATEAAEVLGVNLQTLYVYVGRKGIRSQPVPGTRQKRYWRADIERIQRRESNLGAVALRVRDESRLTLITQSELFYRGQNAVELATSTSFEAVAALLWDVPEARAFGTEAPATSPLVGPANQLFAAQNDVNRYMAVIPILEEANPKAHDLSRQGMARTGADILRWLAALVTFADAPTAEPIHAFIGRRLGLRDAEADLVRRLLVLAADHGFEPGAVAVRAIAGCGVTPWRAVLGGLATTLGRRSKLGNFDASSRLVSEIIAGAQPTDPVVRRIQEGEVLPGFGSRLYPGGDPRARALLDQARVVYDGDEEFQKLDLAFRLAEEIQGLAPNFGMACLVVGRKIGLAPRHTLFNLGRAAGWIAHAIEQHELGEWDHLPGSYRGPLPGSGSAEAR